VKLDGLLKADVAERMLSGLPGHEYPPPLRGVAALLDATARGDVSQDPTHETHTVAMMLVEIGGSVSGRSPTSTRRRALDRSPRRTFLKTKLVAALTAAMLATGTGLAFAGALPSALQREAAHVLRVVGIRVPEPGSADRAHPARRRRQPRPGSGAIPIPAGDGSHPALRHSKVTSGDQDGASAVPADHPGENDPGAGVSGDPGDQNDQGSGVSSDQGDRNDQGSTAGQDGGSGGGAGGNDSSGGQQGSQGSDNSQG